jgi:hypothetical protein
LDLFIELQKFAAGSYFPLNLPGQFVSSAPGEISSLGS